MIHQSMEAIFVSDWTHCPNNHTELSTKEGTNCDLCRFMIFVIRGISRICVFLKEEKLNRNRNRPASRTDLGWRCALVKDRGGYFIYAYINMITECPRRTIWSAPCIRARVNLSLQEMRSSISFVVLTGAICSRSR